MALRGVQRATVDLDFILMLQDLDKADAIFRRAGYERVFKSENVSHYFSRDLGLGRIRDWADIQQVLESASESYQSIDWELLSDYLALFNLSNQLGKMKGWYGTLK